MPMYQVLELPVSRRSLSSIVVAKDKHAAADALRRGAVLHPHPTGGVFRHAYDDRDSAGAFVATLLVVGPLDRPE